MSVRRLDWPGLLRLCPPGAAFHVQFERVCLIFAGEFGKNIKGWREFDSFMGIEDSMV